MSARDIKPLHIPVMLDETLDYLDIRPKSTIIDMTFGSGGHAKEILLRHKDCHVIALDRDEAAFEIAKTMASQFEYVFYILYSCHTSPLFNQHRSTFIQTSFKDASSPRTAFLP